MPHQLFLTSIPRWCGTSLVPKAFGIPPSAFASLSTPQAQGSLSSTTPQCPWRNLGVLRKSQLEGTRYRHGGLE